MNRKPVCTFIALCATILVVSAAPEPAAAQVEVLDQEYLDVMYPDPDRSTVTGIVPDRFYEPAQSFTVGVEGTLSKIQLYVIPRGATNADVTLHLYNVVADLPATELASVHAASGMNGDFAPFRWVTFDLSALGLHVSPGQMFAAGLTTTRGNPWWRSDWFDAPGPLYSGGSVLQRVISRWGHGKNCPGTIKYSDRTFWFRSLRLLRALLWGSCCSAGFFRGVGSGRGWLLAEPGLKRLFAKPLAALEVWLCESQGAKKGLGRIDRGLI